MPYRKGKLEELHCPPQTFRNKLVMFDILRTYTVRIKLYSKELDFQKHKCLRIGDMQSVSKYNQRITGTHLQSNHSSLAPLHLPNSSQPPSSLD